MEYSNQLFDYIESHSDAEPEGLHALDRQTNLRMVHPRMCSGRYQGRLLAMLTHMIRPRRVLELGTFTGYSTICMASAMTEDSRLVTIEIFDENEDFIRHNLKNAGVEKRVDLMIGDALELMRKMERESFDLIFIDADKRQYPEYLKICKTLLRPGGFIIADNTLWDGHVLDAERHDPLTLGVKEFNEMVAEDPEMEKVILPVRDGMTLIRKK